MKETKRFVILIPHKDAVKILDGYRSALFAAGFAGAYSFPSGVPLAEVSRPFDREELKALARNIRGRTEGNGGKLSSAGAALVSGIWQEPGAADLFGPALDLPAGTDLFPAAARDKILRVFLSPVLCAALTSPDEKGIKEAAEKVPALSFRAAALANLSIRPLPSGAEFSCEWKTGPLVWLPPYGRK